MGKRKKTGSRRQMMREQRLRRKRQQRLVTILTISVVALVVTALLIYPTLKLALAPVGEIIEIVPNPRPMADFNAMGDPEAPVRIEEFSDFQCPFCKRFYDETEGQIVDAYVATGKVYFVYTPFGPGGSWIGPESLDASKAAYCAGDQDKFWEYHDILFANHTGENVGDYTEKRLMAFAESLNLDAEVFRTCFRSNKYDDELKQGLADGKRAGMSSTPAFSINGTPVIGAQPFSVFQTEIEAALASAGG